MVHNRVVDWLFHCRPSGTCDVSAVDLAEHSSPGRTIRSCLGVYLCMHICDRITVHKACELACDVMSHFVCWLLRGIHCPRGGFAQQATWRWP
jgi:hypothetical protein